MKNPIQPIEDGRFKSNKIVEHLLADGPFDMNTIAIKEFSQDDREQFAQLIGYSLGGYGDLGYVTDYTYSTADNMTEGLTEDQARIAHLENKLNNLTEIIRKLTAQTFRICEEDLHL